MASNGKTKSWPLIVEGSNEPPIANTAASHSALTRWALAKRDVAMAAVREYVGVRWCVAPLPGFETSEIPVNTM